MKKNIKKYIPWIILLVLITSLFVWYVLSRKVTQEQSSAYENRVEQAATHMEAMQFSVAMNKYYEAADIIPNRLDAYEGIVSILLIKNRLDYAEEVIEESAKALSNYDKSVLYKKLGDQYYQLKNFRKAYDMYDAGSFLGVNNMELELMLAKTHLNLGDMGNARKQLNRSGYEGKEMEETNLLLSYIDAIDDPQKAKNTLNSLADVEEMDIYYDEFRTLLDSLDEDKKFNATKLARIYINNGYPYLAILILEPKKDDISEYLEGMYYLGRAYYEFGDHVKAIETLDGALTLSGMENEIFWIKARSYFRTNDLENAINSYDSAIGHSEGVVSTALAMEYVDLLLENNQVLKALDLIRSLLIAYPDEPRFNLLAVNINYELGEKARVEYYIDRLEELGKEVQFVRNEERDFLKWKILTLLEEYEKVDENIALKLELERYMERLFELDKFSPYYRYYMARVYAKEAQEEMAIQSLEQAIEYDLDYFVTDEALKLLSSLR
jgi:tetratricopeptide (TPR) repeat protein